MPIADPWSAAWAEAEATVPKEVVVYSTLEFQHPAVLDDNGDPYGIRIVTGTRDDMSFAIEDGAALNGGETVEFKAIPFTADFPEVGEGRVPQTVVTVNNVAREMLPVLERAVAVRADLIAIFRQYRSDDLSEPCYGPVQYVIKKATISGTTLQGAAMVDNLSNKKFPTRNYNRRQFPGLL